jgi:hypothetical protein
MIDPNSRYYPIADAVYESPTPDGTQRRLVYKCRRFLPAAEQIPLLTEHVTAAGDRLDNLSARYLQDPMLSYRICDANDVMLPRDLLLPVGRRIRIGLFIR